MIIWRHNELGEFEREGEGWSQYNDLPEFARFTYGSADSTVQISIATDSADVEPSHEAALLVNRLVNHHDQLVNNIIKAIWRDLWGRGPDSGMWWRNNIEQVLANAGEAFPDGPPALNKADDIFPFLGCLGIRIEEDARNYDKPVACIEFMSAYEDEHCVGVLSNGRRVIGLGYAYPSPDPFREEQINRVRATVSGDPPHTT
jgi:hypothetical protein